MFVGLVAVPIVVVLLVLAIGYMGSAKAQSVDEQIDRLQEMATQACLCDSKGGERGSCWSDFEGAIADLSDGVEGCMCGPESTEYHNIKGSSRVVFTQWCFGACSEAAVPAAREKFKQENADWRDWIED